MTKTNDVENQPPTLTVYAIAVMDNSPTNLVTRKNLDSLSQIIDSNDHLQ